MRLNELSLLLLRLSISYIWLSTGLSKLFNKEFISSFPGTLSSFAKNSPFEFYSSFLNQYIIFSQFAAFANGAGRVWGLDAKLAKK